VARVRELLVSTTAPLKQIASQAGFRYPEYMMRVFRHATGQTPGQFRRAVR
jgi:LacI family transcriptional regulator